MTWNRWLRGPGSSRSAGTGTVARSIPWALPTDGSCATIVMANVRRGLPARAAPCSGLPDEVTELVLRRHGLGEREAGQQHVQVARRQDIGMPQQPGGGFRLQLAQHRRQRPALLG